MKKVLLLSLTLLFVLALTACDKDDDYEITYEVPAEYAGVWYSGALDNRAFVFYEDGRYSLFSVELGSTPQITQQGDYRAEGGRFLLGYISGDSFFIEDQPSILADGNLHWGAYFDRISSVPDEGLLDSLTVMLVPLETYLGEWENDSGFTRLSITETEYLITNQGSVSSGNMVIGQDFLLIGWDNEKLTATEDGGLIWEAMGGTFYPKGSEKVSSAPHKAFVGNWHNETTDQDISISEDGIVSSTSVWSDEDGGISFEFEYDYAEVINGGLGFWLNDIEFNAWIEDGNMVLCEVSWWLDGDDEDEIKDINEYIEGVDYDLFPIDGVFIKR